MAQLTVRLNERRFTVESEPVEIADPRSLPEGFPVAWFVFYPDPISQFGWGPARAVDCEAVGMPGFGSLYGRRLVTQPAEGEWPVPEQELV